MIITYLKTIFKGIGVASYAFWTLIVNCPGLMLTLLTLGVSVLIFAKRWRNILRYWKVAFGYYSEVNRLLARGLCGYFFKYNPVWLITFLVIFAALLAVVKWYLPNSFYKTISAPILIIFFFTLYREVIDHARIAFKSPAGRYWASAAWLLIKIDEKIGSEGIYILKLVCAILWACYNAGGAYLWIGCIPIFQSNFLCPPFIAACSVLNSLTFDFIFFFFEGPTTFGTRERIADRNLRYNLNFNEIIKREKNIAEIEREKSGERWLTVVKHVAFVGFVIMYIMGGFDGFGGNRGSEGPTSPPPPTSAR